MIQSKCSKIDKRPIGTTKYVSTMQLIQTLDFGFWIVVKSDNIVREGSRENKKNLAIVFSVFRARPTTFTTSVRGRVRSIDFFAHDLGECVVTNPPFSELPRVLARLRESGKPFVVIMPCSTLTTRSQTSRSSCLGGASSSGSWWTAWRCRVGGAASTACIFVGDSGCRGTWCS